MSIQDKPAALDHLEVQLNALLKRGLQDDVPTDVFKQILSVDQKFEELKMVLTTQPASKKKWYNRKK
jgi:hypothetical protein